MRTKSNNALPRARRRFFLCITRASDAKWTRSWLSRAGMAVAVVEDNAHGLYGRYRGRYLGTLRQLATLSFHETKNFTCGEGGALLINDANLQSSAPRFFAKREQIEADFSAAKSTSTPGSISDRAICLQTCWPRSSAHSSNIAIRFSRCDDEIWETYARELASWAENKRRPAADRPAGMRTELPHVLRNHAVPREQASIDLAPRRAWGFSRCFIICRYISRRWVCGLVDARANVPSQKIWRIACCVFHFSPE